MELVRSIAFLLVTALAVRWVESQEDEEGKTQFEILSVFVI